MIPTDEELKLRKEYLEAHYRVPIYCSFCCRTTDHYREPANLTNVQCRVCSRYITFLG